MNIRRSQNNKIIELNIRLSEVKGQNMKYEERSSVWQPQDAMDIFK